MNISIIGHSVVKCTDKCYRDFIAFEDLLDNLNTFDEERICTTDDDDCKKHSIRIYTSEEANAEAEVAGTNVILISTAVGLGVVFLLIGGLATFFLNKKFKCCHREDTSKN